MVKQTKREVGQTLKNELFTKKQQLSGINYFRKKLNFRYLTAL